MPRGKKVKFEEEVEVEEIDEAQDDDERYDFKRKTSKSKDDDTVKEEFDPDNVEGEEDDTGQDFGGGYEVEPFNLKNERTTGYFDQEGNYFARKERRDPDAWIADYDEHIQELNKKGKGLAKVPLKNTATGFAEDDEIVDTLALRKTLCDILQSKESVAGALRRLKQNIKEAKEKKDEKLVKEFESKFDLVTETAHSLLSNGFHDIYSDSKEKILQTIQKEENKTDKASSAYATSTSDYSTTTTSTDEGPKWEYKVGEKVYGPHTTQEMQYWWSEGWFSGETPVKIRQYKEEDIYADVEEIPWQDPSELAQFFQQPVS